MFGYSYGAGESSPILKDSKEHKKVVEKKEHPTSRDSFPISTSRWLGIRGALDEKTVSLRHQFAQLIQTDTPDKFLQLLEEKQAECKSDKSLRDFFKKQITLFCSWSQADKLRAWLAFQIAEIDLGFTEEQMALLRGDDGHFRMALNEAHAKGKILQWTDPWSVVFHYSAANGRTDLLRELEAWCLYKIPAAEHRQVRSILRHN